MVRVTFCSFLSASLLGLVVGCSSGDESLVLHEGGGYEYEATGPGVVVYPSGPYGRDVGSTVRNFKFAGFLNPLEADYTASEDTIFTIRFSDYYNPDGDPGRPVALLVNASALWCPVCRQEAAASKKAYNDENGVEFRGWRERGVEFITAIFEDEETNPAQFVHIESWSKQYSLEYPVVLDPRLTLGVFFDQSASPFNMIIDTRTMKIVYAAEGYVDIGQNNSVLQSLTEQ